MASNIWFFFTRRFHGDHYAKGKEERRLWKQFINDADFISKSEVKIIIEDLQNLPTDAEIHAIDEAIEVNRKFNVAVSVDKRFLKEYSEAITSAGYRVSERGSAIEISIPENESIKGTTGKEYIDEFLGKLNTIYKEGECGDFELSLACPEEATDTEFITEGSFTVERKITEVRCKGKKALNKAELVFKNLTETKASKLYDLFKSRDSQDSNRIYNLLFSELNLQYNYPSYLSTIKNMYESRIAQLIGESVDKISAVFEKLARTLASYEAVNKILHSPENLHAELSMEKEKKRRTYVFFFLLALLSLVDFALNYYTFNAVFGDKYESLLIITTFGYGALIVIAAEAYVILCGDYKDVVSRRSMYIVVPLLILLMSSGYLRYYYELGKGAEESMLGGMSLDSLGTEGVAEHTVKYVMTAFFFTFFSLLVFVSAVSIAYWRKYGNLRLFFNKYLAIKFEDKIKQYRKKIQNHNESYFNSRINTLIQSCQREFGEYINGFEQAQDEELNLNPNEHRRFTAYLHWLKSSKVLRVGSGSQINDDKFNAALKRIDAKMLHYLKLKSKSIAFEMGFRDAVNGLPRRPDGIIGNPQFHLEDSSIGVGLANSDINSCYEAYEYGFSHGEKKKA